MLRILMVLGVLLSAAATGFAADPSANEVRSVVAALGEQAVAASAQSDAEARRQKMNEGARGFDFPAIAHAMMSQANVQVPAGREAEIVEGVEIFVMREIGAQLEQIRPRKAEVGEIDMKSPTQAQAQLTLAGLDRQLKAEWLLYKFDFGWRITDITVSGKSLIARLAGKLKDHAGNIDRLIAFLRSGESA
jgi:ABC-type transporter MlaC component